MILFLTLVAALICLAGCTPRPAATAAKSAAPSGDTQFSGTVGQLEEGARFIEFIGRHEQQTVDLDVRIAAEGFDGGRDGGAAFFIVWDECDNLPEGQKPNNSFCTGFEYSVPNLAGGRSPLVEQAGGWRLRGQFTVENTGGPHQGLMTVQLRPSDKQRGGNR